MRSTHLRFWVIFSLMIFFLTAACDDDKTSDKKEVSALEFMWIPKELGNQVFETGRDGAFAKATQLSALGSYEVNLTYAGPESALDVEGQVDVIQLAIDSDFDGIAISCNTPEGLEQAINKATAAGIPVMTFDSDSQNSKRFSYLGIDNEYGGTLAAQILGQSMVDSPLTKVALVSGVQGAANLDARVQGFQKKLAEDFPTLEIIDTVYCDDKANTAATLIEGLLSDNPDIGGLFFVGLWPLFVCESTDCSEKMPLWDAAAKSGEVKTVVFDTLEFQLDFVKNGMVSGLVGQKYWGWGYDAVQMLYDYIVTGKKFSAWTDSGIDVVCPNNVGEMEIMWDKIDFTTALSPCEINGLIIE